MKRLLLSTVSLGLIVWLCGCGEEPPPPGETKPPVQGGDQDTQQGDDQDTQQGDDQDTQQGDDQDAQQGDDQDAQQEDDQDAQQGDDQGNPQVTDPAPDEWPDDPPPTPAKLKEMVDNTEWQITLTLQGTTRKEEDTVRIVGKKFSSEKFVAEGFSATNFTPRPKPRRIMTIETMQTREDGSTLQWALRLQGDTLRGQLVKKVKRRKDEVYSVNSTASKKVSPPAPEPKPEG